MGAFGECEKEGDGNEMAGDKQDTTSRSEQIETHNEKYGASATKADGAEKPLLAARTLFTSPNMPAHAKFTSPRRINAEDSRTEPRSADSAPNALPGAPNAPPEVVSVRSRRASHASGDVLIRWNERADHSIAIPPCMNELEVEALLEATPHPPVTKHSLEELELTYIQSNITLRIDINFDHDLHFTPISGEKGAQKKKDSRRYWHALECEFKLLQQHSLLISCAECEELRSSSSDNRGFEGRLLVFTRRLPQLFHELRELLIILVPERDQYQVSEYLDISLLLQEVSHGLLDIVRLAEWLDVLLTSHCAPMRDMSAHEMAEKIRQGAKDGDARTLVAGVEMLFQILEAMKLDVANHQIRSFRYPLIDDTVAFQQEFFRSRIASGDFDGDTSREWYCAGLARHQDCAVERQTPRSMPVGVLVHGMLGACLWHGLEVPATFAYDHKRLKEIRVDVLDHIHLDMCLAVFRQLFRKLAQSKISHMQGVSESQFKETQFCLRNRIMDLTDGSPDEVPQIWLQHAEAIAIEISRAASHIWLGAASPISAVMVANTLELLTRMFEHEHEHQEHAQELQVAIEQEAHKHAIKFQNMSTLEISLAQKHWQQARAQRYRWRLLPEVEDVARRLAHMASIHWRVWADLVYLKTGDGHAIGVNDNDNISGEDLKMTDGPMDYVQQRSLEEDTPVH